MVYNCALAHHMEGLRRTSSALSFCALKLYSPAYKALVFGKINEDCTKLAVLALVNNIGHVHSYFRCLEGAALCSSELCLRLATVPVLPISLYRD